PTLADISQTSIDNPIDGKSFAPVLFGEAETRGHEYLYWEFPSYNGQQAVRMGDWKGVRTNMMDGNLEIELYNLAIDPTEQKNIASENPEVVASIKKAMEEAHRDAELPKFRIPVISNQ
ncbi:MAG TPA: sulfatase/phosphatase domain-containing protein, partial [Roseivirga sp.]